MPEFTISGSEAASALGLDPYRSAVRLWSEKTGRLAPEPPHGDAAEAGTRLEAVVREWAEDRESIVITPWNGAPAPSDGWLVGHPDGEAYRDGLHVYEGKTTGQWRAGEWSDGAVPPQYVIQAHVYMHLLDWDETLFACLIAGQRLVTQWIPRDRRLEDAMLAGLAEFHDRLVTDRPPPPDGSDDAADVLKLLYPRATPEVQIQGTPDDFRLCRDLAVAKASVKSWKQQEQELENQLRARMGDGESLTYEGETIATWRNVDAVRQPQEGGPYSYRRLTVKVKP
jgi:predicted phage-related endonuclease